MQESDVMMLVFTEVGPVQTSPEIRTKSYLQITWHDINLAVIDSNTAKLAAEFIKQLQNIY